MNEPDIKDVIANLNGDQSLRFMRETNSEPLPAGIDEVVLRRLNAVLANGVKTMKKMTVKEYGRITGTQRKNT